jgi:predicted  nucleic acid-binding Zn-ribbon protein
MYESNNMTEPAIVGILRTKIEQLREHIDTMISERDAERKIYNDALESWVQRAKKAEAEVERLHDRETKLSERVIATQDFERLRVALEMIAGKRQCIDNLMGDKDIARHALEPER